MWLPWYYALALGVALVAVGAGAGRRSRRRSGVGSPPWAIVAETSTEAARVAFLYALWNFGGRLSIVGTDGAIRRGQALWDFQQRWRVPSERAIQELFVDQIWIQRIANGYYAGMHVPMIGLVLVWMFLRHRPYYARWRNRLVWVTIVCLVIQLLVPVAPPRLVPGLGVIDTGATVGPSVYAVVGSSLSGQATAMPSLHVGWAALVALALWQHGSRPQRWLGVAHLLGTVFVVTVTGHHFWADGVVALVILAIVVPLTRWRQPGVNQPSTPSDRKASMAA